LYNNSSFRCSQLFPVHFHLLALKDFVNQFTMHGTNYMKNQVCFYLIQWPTWCTNF